MSTTRDDLLGMSGGHLSPLGEAMLEWFRGLSASEQEACAVAVDEVIRLYKMYGRRNGLGVLGALELLGVYVANEDGLLRQKLMSGNSGR